MAENIEKVKRSVEALLFAVDYPLTAEKLAELVGNSVRAVRQAIGELNEEYKGRSFEIRRVAGGYQLFTKEEYGPLVSLLFEEKKRVRLTKAGLEVLAIIAYNQPVSRQEIDRIRGVRSSEGVIATLMGLGLIEVVGRGKGPGRPLLYGTTALFLEYLKIDSLKDLPAMGNDEAE